MNNESWYEKETKMDSDFYKLKEGSNIFRILTDFQRVESINRGQKYAGIVTQNNQPQKDDNVSVKGWAWALVKSKVGEELKIVQLSKTVLGLIVAYMNNPEYSFSSFPMPYDINVQAVGAGTKEVKYAVIAGRTNSEVSESTMVELNKKKSIADIIGAIADKQDGKTTVTTTATANEVGYKSPEEEGINPDDVPF